MELVEVKASKRNRHKGILMLRINDMEALQLIRSLTEQMLAGSPNAGRHEWYLKDGRDFSIAVHRRSND